jgi:hypothetical protein
MPTRASEPNSSIPATLPELDVGVNVLTADSSVRRAIHVLAVDYVLRSGGDACWVDPGTHAQTGPLVELAPSSRILDRIRVARGFTPFQHLDLLRSLPGWCTERTELVVVPHLDCYYRDDGLLADEGEEMLLSGLASLARAARQHDIPVLVTSATTDAFSRPIVTAATRTLTCESTPFGPRFRADGEETLVYPTDDSGWVQTTLAFWERVLAAREPLYGSQQGQDEGPSQQPHGGVTRGTN